MLRWLHQGRVFRVFAVGMLLAVGLVFSVAADLDPFLSQWREVVEGDGYNFQYRDPCRFERNPELGIWELVCPSWETKLRLTNYDVVRIPSGALYFEDILGDIWFREVIDLAAYVPEDSLSPSSTDPAFRVFVPPFSDEGQLMTVLVNGNAGFSKCLYPDHDLTVGGSGEGCNTGTFSELDAGEATFTISSSRAIKENLAAVPGTGILDKIQGTPVYTYDFIDGPKDKMGLMAEDFHAIFGRGNSSEINGNEVMMALWLAVQELHGENEELKKRIEKLEN